MSKNNTRPSMLTGYRDHTLADVKETYREQATTMANMDWLNQAFTGRYRRALFGDATGRVLDVGCGVGTSAQYLGRDTEYVGIDISDAVLTEAEQRLDDSPQETTLYEMDAQDLDFPNDSFDTVISSLSTCTFPNRVEALSEMGRVCAPDGRILLLEHGRSSVGPIARFQDWRADAHFEKHSCRWNQDPLAVVAESPLTTIESSSAFFGMITAIEARPA
ncbi:class I SAM-dependent methyltransferase (plasmid) [Haloarcula salina]|uniref:class I SAM-dependent methyltransferase n=1 Tax=Haloarcula salina TaxID=1429914 RepID=UPI003C6FF6BF